MTKQEFEKQLYNLYPEKAHIVKRNVKHMILNGELEEIVYDNTIIEIKKILLAQNK